MTLIATRYQDDDFCMDYTSVAALTAGTPIQLPDGRAGISANDIAAGAKGAVATKGIFTVAKTASIVLLDGARVYYDHSAGTATYAPANDEDFFLGHAVGDSAAATTTVKVNLNVESSYIVDLHSSGFEHVPVLTAGTPSLAMVGGTARAAFSATAEAQKLDLLSKRSFPLDSNWIIDAVVEVSTTCDADVGDLNIGAANATHASDADAIDETAFFHFDLGGSLNILAESDDGTTEVGATDTTLDFVVGTPVYLTLDGRDPTDVRYYVNGVEVLNGTANLGDIQLATGPMKALFHLEKSANDSLGVVELDHFTVRQTEQ